MGSAELAFCYLLAASDGYVDKRKQLIGEMCERKPV
jgi:hypothetical protein